MEFDNRSQDFLIHVPVFPYLIKPDLLDLTTIQFDIDLLKWMDIDNFEMQLVDFKISELWTSNFAELQKALEGDCLDESAVILTCWTSLPEIFIGLK